MSPLHLHHLLAPRSLTWPHVTTVLPSDLDNFLNLCHSSANDSIKTQPELSSVNHFSCSQWKECVGSSAYKDMVYIASAPLLPTRSSHHVLLFSCALTIIIILSSGQTLLYFIMKTDLISLHSLNVLTH